jgi:hypothetical protein
MKNKCIRGLAALLLAALLLPAAGCGAARSLYQKVSPGKRSDLDKKVLLLPVVDQQGLGQELMEELTARLAEGLEGQGRLVVHRSPEPMAGTYTWQSPGQGVISGPDPARKAEEQGMNVLVTCVLNRYEVIDHGAGIWPINKIPVRPFAPRPVELEISMVVNAVDITNGTLFLSNLESRRIKVPAREEDEDALFVKEREPRSEREMIEAVPEPERRSALKKLVDEQVKVIAGTLEKNPWSGRLLSAGPENIMINAGRDVGLDQGFVFEVFSRGELMPSVEGRSVSVLGPKVGEIRVVSVAESYSSAVPVSGEGFEAGQIIREKP